MSDRLTLANAIEDAGIERGKAERVASVIIDIIHDNVATKADVQAVRADLQTAVRAVRGELQTAVQAVRGKLQTAETRLNGQIAGVRADLALVEHRLMTRLGGLAVVLSGLLFVALRYWPPH